MWSTRSLACLHCSRPWRAKGLWYAFCCRSIPVAVMLLSHVRLSGTVVNAVWVVTDLVSSIIFLQPRTLMVIISFVSLWPIDTQMCNLCVQSDISCLDSDLPRRQSDAVSSAVAIWLFYSTVIWKSVSNIDNQVGWVLLYVRPFVPSPSNSLKINRNAFNTCALCEAGILLCAERIFLLICVPVSVSTCTVYISRLFLLLSDPFIETDSFIAAKVKQLYNTFRLRLANIYIAIY